MIEQMTEKIRSNAFIDIADDSYFIGCASYWGTRAFKTVVLVIATVNAVIWQ